jgi:hypothetical protein
MWIKVVGFLGMGMKSLWFWIRFSSWTRQAEEQLLNFGSLLSSCQFLSHIHLLSPKKAKTKIQGSNSTGCRVICSPRSQTPSATIYRSFSVINHWWVLVNDTPLWQQRQCNGHVIKWLFLVKVPFQLFLSTLRTLKGRVPPTRQNSGAGAPQRHLLWVKGNIVMIIAAWRGIAQTHTSSYPWAGLCKSMGLNQTENELI